MDEPIDPIAALQRAGADYRRRLAAVTPDQWDQPSVCDEWTVKDLADHVLGGNRFAVALLAGASSGDAFAQALGGGFDDDPVASFDESVANQADAFDAPGALDVTVDHPAGPTSGRVFAGLRLGDLLLHAWDLARSTGGDESLDEELAAEVWRVYEPRLAVGGGDRFGDGATGALPADAPLTLRLLDLSGRRP